MTDILGMMDYIRQQGDAGRKAGLEQHMGTLYAQAMQAPADQRPNLLAQIAQMSPDYAMSAQKNLNSQDADGHLAMAQEANQFLAVQQMGDPAATQQAYSRLVQHARALRFPVPDQYDDRFLPGIQKLASAGRPQEQLAPHVIGSALVDNTGKVLYQGQATTKPPTYVDVPDGQGGSIKMQYDPASGGLVPLKVGGPQAAPDPSLGPGPATQAVSGQPFYDSVLASIAPLGGILGSTTGGQHNVGSLHPDGRAVDIPLGASASPEAKAHADQMLAALQAQGFTVRDERTHPAGQAVWSGPHLHVEAPGASGGRLGYNPPKGGADSALQQRITLARQMGASDDQIKQMVLGGQAGQGVPDVPGDATKTGEAYLATLPPQMRGVVKAIAEGQLAPPSASSRSPQAQALLQAVYQYDPTANATNLPARTQTRKDFTSGKSANNLRALNQAIGHLGLLDSQISGTAGHSGFPGAQYVNAAQNAYNRVSGDPGITKYDQTSAALAGELTQVFRGSGGAEADIARFLRELDSAQSEPQKRAAVANIVGLLNSRIEELGQQYTQGMGKTTDPFTLLNPHAAEILRHIRGGGGAPAAGGGYHVGQVIEHNGKRYRVTGGDPNDPDVEEVR
jgi:hypothetical protein